MGAVCTGHAIPKKVLIIGPKGAGKTSVLYGWCSTSQTETLPTESFNVETIYGIRTGQLMLIWDVTDRQRRRQFYHGTDALVYVVDSGDRNSIVEAQTDLSSVLHDRDLMNLPLLLIISKQDISGRSVSEVEKELQIGDTVVSGKYASVGVAKSQPATYSRAFERLCDILYS